MVEEDVEGASEVALGGCSSSSSSMEGLVCLAGEGEGRKARRGSWVCSAVLKAIKASNDGRETNQNCSFKTLKRGKKGQYVKR